MQNVIEDLLEQGRVNLSKESEKSLLKDLEKFKYGTIRNGLLKELFRRTDTTWFLKIDKFELWLTPEGWWKETCFLGTFPTSTGWRRLPLLEEVKDRFQKYGSQIKLFEIRAQIQGLEQNVKDIRFELTMHPEKKLMLFGRLFQKCKELRNIDPDNAELNPGMNGRPGGLIALLSKNL
jgi:hypothetical protein